MNTIMLCAISSLSAGNCSEDCAYCTQSVGVKSDIQRYNLKTPEQVIAEAKKAYEYHALGFCLVTSGARLTDKKTEDVARIAKAVSEAVPELMLIACNGMATREQLRELKKAGVFSYNHNLETSREYFSKICTTHSWDERYETNLNAQAEGLQLCCGGIYGIGESEADRVSFRRSLTELKPFSSPINFFIANPALNLQQPRLSVDEALKIIDDTVKTLPNTRIMIAGGREAVLGERQYEIFDHGVSAVVIGDYLTTKGEERLKDIEQFKKMGFSFASKCH
ncbi:biotin synthase [Campylobacter sp. faydin G-24]|uniref:Biotin synthase n=1 Tax=Campylobacter anatolicus TaxID=2829105 RepID=A0ABS5HGR7_9BACT|nr:biotin synthase [Campylobacter anatolicus]MBR8463292.1 biotin synthase [Campylobacter anatolicus]